MVSPGRTLRYEGRETTASISLRKHPFLLALRRYGRFARRNARRRARRNGCFRRLCEHPPASLIEPLSSAMDEKNKLQTCKSCLKASLCSRAFAYSYNCCLNASLLWIFSISLHDLPLSTYFVKCRRTQMELNSKRPYPSSRAKRRINFVVACLRYP